MGLLPNRLGFNSHYEYWVLFQYLLYKQYNSDNKLGESLFNGSYK